MEELKRHVDDTLEFLPGALIEFDISKMAVTYMNRMAFFLFGYPPTKEPLNIPIQNIFLNETEFQRAKKLTESFGLDSYEKKIPYTRFEKQELHDFWFKKVDGEPFYGGSQGSFILDEAQVPIGVRLYIRDLTEERKTEKALLESEQKYRTLVEFSTDLIFLADEEGIVLSVNKAAAKSVGGLPEEIQGKHISELFPPDIVKKYQESLREIFVTGKGSSYESCIRMNKRTIWIDTSLNPVKSKSGEVTAVLGVSRDITERKLAEIKIEESDSLRELLLDVVTHDLKTPASVIYGLADMAREYLPEDEVVESIFLSSQRLLGVLENTSVLSRAVFGEQIPKSVLVLNELMLEIANEFTSQLESTGMSLEIQIPAEIKITANPLIGEAFKNFISNAIKYAKDGKKIIIEAIEGNDSVMIGFKDFGRTIPIEKRNLIFERGSQLSKTNKSGRGLGLAIVKRIAKAHNSDVGVEPNKPSGNIFYLRLPQ
ncbi:MAG: PAS domain-containing sensor histidine kinase [Candidatus Marinimicrobia bacterium]|jgi:PAS domain S-box-containing protein|nr:PAS domain-containing sensor histidine kinase [Candidatus Neomarinimicrobiota bacterium]MBT3576475.1 PAS domain-containing sensor histidine kinase [Candidatus Neomarinimicrobiota bacterium]MBT3681261.1 PAS domain-containing sensor histidine kinase [Candidatus Neomarinimicrobiota bacterium]MBT4130854.1 PAS domain-containing sensor histidine kinase [Candidatus Neomarinimicrobiota bacterium]MBT4295879.1 PAS domain-containing sensor histidine kinase [Candidatus Neomarinimicrobiota bacterium]